MNATPARCLIRHLVSEKSAELSEFEFGLMIASEAFNAGSCAAWAPRGCATSPPWTWWSSTVSITADARSGSTTSVSSQYRGCPSRHYALKKLGRLGLVERNRRGKEVVSRPRRPAATCALAIARCAMLPHRGAVGLGHHRQSRDRRSWRVLRALSGIYDQAPRATSL